MEAAGRIGSANGALEVCGLGTGLSGRVGWQEQEGKVLAGARAPGQCTWWKRGERVRKGWATGARAGGNMIHCVAL